MRRHGVLFAAFLFASTALLAQPAVPDGKWWKRPRIAAEIGLTPDQVREIEKIFVRSRPRLIDLKGDVEKKQLALASAMEDHAIDRREVERRIEAVETARAELQKTRALMVLDMKQVLKPDQWSRLLERQQGMRDRRRRLLRDGLSGRRGDGAQPGRAGRAGPGRRG